MKIHPTSTPMLAAACLAIFTLSGCQTPYSESEEKDPLGYLIESEAADSSTDYDPISRALDSGKLE